MKQFSGHPHLVLKKERVACNLKNRQDPFLADLQNLDPGAVVFGRHHVLDVAQAKSCSLSRQESLGLHPSA